MIEKKLKKIINPIFLLKKTCQPMTKVFGPEILNLKKKKFNSRSIKYSLMTLKKNPIIQKDSKQKE